MELYPLKFYEIYKPKIWGGRALETVLGKRLPGGEIGESWEISDHFDDVSTVRNGALEGRSLRELWRAEPALLLGRALASRDLREFPLLVKFIHAREILSVQVHPDDDYARRHDPSGESGKNEAWHVLAAEPGARLVLGVKKGTTKERFVSLLEAGAIEECLNYVEVCAGDTIHIGVGTVHAVGPGIVLYEVQQTSDATYRLWDWGRAGADGKPRPLHVEHAVNVIDFERGPVGKVAPEPVRDVPCRRDVLDKCEFFLMEKIRSAGRFVEKAPADRFYILTFVAGSGSVVCEGERYPYARGDSVLIPAVLPPVAVEPAQDTTVLKSYIP